MIYIFAETHDQAREHLKLRGIPLAPFSVCVLTPETLIEKLQGIEFITLAMVYPLDYQEMEFVRSRRCLVARGL